MSLSKAKVREILSKAGVDAEHMQEALTEILDGNTASLDAIKEERDRYKEDAQRYQAAEKELETLKANGEKSPYKVKYEALVKEREELRKEFEDYKNSIEAEKSRAKKKDAYKQLLIEAGVIEPTEKKAQKRLETILKFADLDSFELDEHGSFIDSDRLNESIKDLWGAFIPTEMVKGALVANPPASNTNGTPMTREEIMKIKNTSERQKAWEKFLENERKK